MTKLASLAALLAVTVFAACSDDGPGSPADAAPLPPATGVDVLFVIDDSLTMAEEQAALADVYFEPFLAALETAHGSRPDLHIGVISTTIDVGYGITNCVPGDNGALRVGGPSGCPALNGSYISDVSDGSGGRSVNYTGAIGEVFSCQAQLGTDGCAFEQPLAALEASLGNLGNYGFFRLDAALAIVIVADEDDCSADDTTVYDPSPKDLDDPLGPLHSFRCFEFGVVCSPDEPRVEGVKTGCTVRTGSYLTDPAAVADAVHAFRPPGRVAVAVITGAPSAVAVGPDPENPENPALLPSCESALGPAAPGIRLQAFAAAFPGAGTTGSICDSSAAPLQTLADQIAALIE